MLACSEPPPPPTLTSDQATEIEVLLRHAHDAAQSHEDAVRLAVTRASGHVGPGDAACSLVIPELSSLEPVTSMPLSSQQTVAARGVSRFIGPADAALDDLPGPMMDSLSLLNTLWQTRRTSPVYGGTPTQLMDQARAEIRASAPAHELVLHARQIVMPQVDGADTFTPGELIGELYALDASQNILCVTPVRSTSGGTVRTFDPARQGGLVLDLIVRGVLIGYPMLREAVETPAAAGPPGE